MFDENLWGTFGTVHLALLALAVILTVATYFILRNASKRIQILALFTLSLFAAGTVLYNTATAGTYEDVLRNLPLDWWALATLILPFAVLFRGKYTCNILLLWSLGSLWRLIFNLDVTGVEYFTAENILAYVVDVICAGTSILIFELRLEKRNPKTLKRTLWVSIFTYTIVYLTNSAIHHFAGFKVNYMSSVMPTNEFLAFIYQLVPAQYFYVLFVIPFVVFYMFWWYLPEMLEQRRENKNLRAKLKAVNKYYRKYRREYIDEIIDEKKY